MNEQNVPATVAFHGTLRRKCPANEGSEGDQSSSISKLVDQAPVSSSKPGWLIPPWSGLPFVLGAVETVRAARGEAKGRVSMTSLEQGHAAIRHFVFAGGRIRRSRDERIAGGLITDGAIPPRRPVRGCRDDERDPRERRCRRGHRPKRRGRARLRRGFRGRIRRGNHGRRDFVDFLPRNDVSGKRGAIQSVGSGHAVSGKKPCPEKRPPRHSSRCMITSSTKDS